MRVLFIGDVFGRPGRRAVRRLLPGLRQDLQIDLTVCNGENASGGLGLTAKAAGELFLAGVDVITTGNHVWRHKDLVPLLEQEPHVLRPQNYPPGTPGNGWVTVKGLGQGGALEATIVNLEGRVFMSPLECPFRTMDKLLDELLPMEDRREGEPDRAEASA